MNRYRILVSVPARKQIGQITRWWRRERARAPFAFTDELRQAFELLLQHPLAGRAIEDEQFACVRRLSLNRTHYFLFYELRESEVVIIGLRHQSRSGDLP